jgi:multidrug efflux system outer membrane protein
MALVPAMLLAACSLEPRYVAPPLPVAGAWPKAAASAPLAAGSGDAAAASDAGDAADIGWREFFADAQLQALIAQALADNRDLRVAALNVRRARAEARIRAAQRWPALALAADASRQRVAPTANDAGATGSSLDAGLAVPAFELDLFGRVASLSHAALERYLAEEATQEAVQIGLVAAVADAYMALMADRQALQLASDTLQNQQRQFELTRERHAHGAASGLDLAQARTIVEAARADVARYQGDVAQDVDALTLLAGAPVAASQLAAPPAQPLVATPELPLGLPSTVLLRRPDVRAAEHRLRAAHADVGAARAARFPSVSLTALAGTASDSLSGLFRAGSGAWSVQGQAAWPIFDGGAGAAGVEVSQADREIALAQYDKTVQVAFREVADALQRADALRDQREATQALVQAASQAYALSQSRYKAGRDSYLVVLDSQRSLYAAQLRLIEVTRAEQSNRVALYSALGGGWRAQRVAAAR